MRFFAFVALLSLVALASAMSVDCPGTFTSCSQQATSGGCCRCATPTSTWQSSSCFVGGASGSNSNKCALSCGNNCASSSDYTQVQVDCNTPCVASSCDCGFFRLVEVAPATDPETGGLVFIAFWKACNLCNGNMDFVAFGGFSGWNQGQFNVRTSGVDQTSVQFGMSLASGAAGTAPEFKGVVFRPVSSQFGQGACALFRLATNDASILQNNYQWLTQMAVNGDFEKTTNCANSGGGVTTGCLGRQYEFCCDGTAVISNDANGGCRQLSPPQGVSGVDCKVCTGPCLPGGSQVIPMSQSCPVCSAPCCDGSSVVVPPGGTANCPTCCFNSVGDYVVTSNPSTECYHRCCTNGALRQGLSTADCASVQCRTCCDGLSLDSNYDERCNCCENANGEVRNVLNLLGSNGNEITEVCYYCRAFCGGLDDLACQAAGQLVTAKFTQWTNDDGTITVRGEYSENFVDNCWGTSAGGCGWGTSGHTMGHMVHSDHVLVAMVAGDGTIPLTFKVDLVSADGLGGWDTSCVWANEGAIDASISSQVVSCETSTAMNCRNDGSIECTSTIVASACGISRADCQTPPCYKNGNTPVEGSASQLADCPGWIYPVWYQWTVQPTLFNNHNGYAYPLITSIHASPSKFGNDNCPVELPDVNCDSLGLEDDGKCYGKCCNTPTGPNVDLSTCPECLSCCDNSQIVRQPGATTPVCPTCGSGNIPCCEGTLVTDAALCPTCCPGGYVAPAGEECPCRLCDGSWAVDGSGNTLCSTRVADSDRCTADCDYTISATYCCPGGEVVSNPNLCSSVVCCEGTVAASQAECPFCCPNGEVAATEADCKDLCCDRIYRFNCPVCCPDGTIDWDLAADATCVVCCDGTHAASESACPFCCPLTGLPVADLSQCDQCNDFPCGPSCVASPVGSECECTVRDSVFAFCCPYSDGSGLYLPCSDGSQPGALGAPWITAEGCPLDCNCSLPETLSSCPDGCSGYGTCNQCTGRCVCDPGFQGLNCGVTTTGVVPPAAPCANKNFCSGVGVCCVNGSQPATTAEEAAACESDDPTNGADDICYCPPGTWDTPTNPGNCSGIPTVPPGVVGGGCSGNGDCEECNSNPACIWCPGAERCVPNGDCATGGDLTCGSAVVERSVPVCYEECFGNGDCVNDTCICYDFNYINQDHPYCAPVNAAGNSAAKASIGLIAGGSVGLFVLAVICGVVFLIGTKAAFDAFSMHDESVNVMENCALYEDPGLSGTSAIHDPKA